MIHVLVQHPTPYFDDSYAVNSVNNGPYGDAITLDLIPMIEKQFRGIGAGWARVTDRRIDRRLGSVRRPGVLPGRLQRRLGALSRSDRLPLLSLGQHLRRAQRLLLRGQPVQADAEAGLSRLPAIICSRPSRIATSSSSRSARTAARPGSTTPGRRCSARSAPTATTSRSTTRRPARSIPTVAAYWRDHYDLRFILQRDWKTLGPKLRGKIHITSGTMDNGYLNNAVYQMEEFLGHAVPSPEYEITYGERREHCFTGDTETLEHRRQPHRPPALHAGDGAVDDEDGAAPAPTPGAGSTDVRISRDACPGYNEAALLAAAAVATRRRSACRAYRGAPGAISSVIRSRSTTRPTPRQRRSPRLARMPRLPSTATAAASRRRRNARRRELPRLDRACLHRRGDLASSPPISAHAIAACNRPSPALSGGAHRRRDGAVVGGDHAFTAAASHRSWPPA